MNDNLGGDIIANGGLLTSNQLTFSLEMLPPWSL